MARLALHDVHVAFRLPSEDRDRLHAIAQAKGESLSELLREMCTVVLATEAPEPPQRPFNVFIERARLDAAAQAVGRSRRALSR
jgi:hypothetical protein